MNNELSNTLNDISWQEQEAMRIVEEKQDEAYRALAELHAAIENLYIIKKAEKAVTTSAQEFINTVMEKVFKMDVDSIRHKQTEARGELEAASYSIAKLLDIARDIEYTIKRGNIE